MVLLKMGTDATTAAIRVARAYTKKEKILSCGYHGWYDAFSEVHGIEAGIPKKLFEDFYEFEFNQLEEIEQLLKTHKDEVAAIIVNPIHTPGGREVELPKSTVYPASFPCCWACGLPHRIAVFLVCLVSRKGAAEGPPVSAGDQAVPGSELPLGDGHEHQIHREQQGIGPCGRCLLRPGHVQLCAGQLLRRPAGLRAVPQQDERQRLAGRDPPAAWRVLHA